jgi:branched-chain amino acid aminotransferase
LYLYRPIFLLQICFVNTPIIAPKLLPMTPTHTPATEKLAFGTTVSDHMLMATYDHGRWSEASIVPFAPISLAPTALGLHYGQSIFEGMKAFRRVDGAVSIFRIKRHWERFCRSAERMCMAIIPEQLFTEGLISLVARDAAWAPDAPDGSLYLRPFLFATEERFGVAVSEQYQFITFTGPVMALYEKALRVKVEDHYIRAAHGGVGFAKCGGNYGGALYPTQLAKKEGFDQVLWTDGTADLNIEESGTMNVMFVIDGVLVTPPLSDTILDGVTRDSLLAIAASWNMSIEERTISAFELVEASRAGTLTEAFGCGTAAVTAPIASISVRGTEIVLPQLSPDSFCLRARQYLTDMRRGVAEDVFGWNTIV